MSGQLGQTASATSWPHGHPTASQSMRNECNASGVVHSISVHSERARAWWTTVP